MPNRKIWHAIFEWFEDGVRHVAYRGDTADIPQDVIDQYEKFGVFDAPAKATEPPAIVSGVDEVVTPADLAGDSDVQASDELPERPKQAASAKAWEDYAVRLFELTAGERGFTREDAEKATKQDLISLLP